MPEPNLLDFFRRWSAVSVAMLILGLLFALPSGLCVGLFAYDLYLTANLTSVFDRGYAQGSMIFGMAVFVFGALIILGAFRLRIGPDDE